MDERLRFRDAPFELPIGVSSAELFRVSRKSSAKFEVDGRSSRTEVASHARMSTQTITKKRKSTGDAATATKKVKTAKSAAKPAPLKSALKKTKVETVVETKAKPGKPVKAKTTKKVKDADAVEETAVETVVPDAEEGGVELTEDQTAALLAGFSSSEDEASGDEEDGVALDKLPQAPRMKEIQKRIKEASADDPERTPGVIYIGRIPHGFFEVQMRAYLSQFGDILHLRLARNRKTGKSQHYGFVEFKSKAVAEIVAKTMDKYLLFGHILQVRTVPQEQVKESMWKGSGKRFKPAPRNRLEGSKLRRGMVREDWDKKIEKEAKRRVDKAEKLKELGYDFEMPALKVVSELPPKSKRIEDATVTEEDAGGVKLLQDKVEAEEIVTEVSRTVQAEPNGVTVTEKKITKKRPSGEVKTKKVQKVKT